MKFITNVRQPPGQVGIIRRMVVETRQKLFNANLHLVGRFHRHGSESNASAFAVCTDELKGLQPGLSVMGNARH
ncbi:hypothetical protein [Zavarzinella formosa]|uniref:hypothetical protein n=1 Tax=Zavarzinella formosa TaxID=360055 RepID=UPI000496C237|nr:hypothetical protein [Zavarzinella formosa]